MDIPNIVYLGPFKNVNMSDDGTRWNFNAPQFVDFSQAFNGLDNTNIEDYFNTDHEAKLTTQEFSQNEFNKEPNRETVMAEDKEKGSNTDSCVEIDNFNDEVADTLASPASERSRTRIVLIADEKRKRLSMSVDRGKSKLENIRKVIPMRNLSVKDINSNLESSQEGRADTEEITPQMTTSQSAYSLEKDDGEKDVDVASAITDGVSEEVMLEVACPSKQIGHRGIPMKISSNSKLTEVKPFSFEKRDQQLKAKRNNYVKKVIEEERKAREFKAQPFPDIIYSVKGKIQIPNCKSKGTAQNPKARSVQSFRAKTASVLRKEPFMPLKPQHNLTEPYGFHLNTEARAQKRAEFEKYLKDKEQKRELGRQLAEKRKLAEEEESIKKLREGLVHKPLPMPSFKQSGEVKKAAVDKENRCQRKK